jgi:hypothetical protein
MDASGPTILIDRLAPSVRISCRESNTGIVLILSAASVHLLLTRRSFSSPGYGRKRRYAVAHRRSAHAAVRITKT